MPLQDKTAEKMLTNVADFIAATQAKPDQRAWDQLWIYCPRDRYTDLADKWLKEAALHDISANEIGDERDEEYTLHREKAETLRHCAQHLLFERPTPGPKIFEDEIKF